MLKSWTDTPVELGISSEWGYGTPLLSKKPLFIFISQSGETADSRQVLVKAMKWAFQVDCAPMFQVQLFHVKQRQLPTLDLEIAVASTKAYTAKSQSLPSG